MHSVAAGELRGNFVTLGIARILVTCDADNIGSIKVIERNGGILENIVTVPGSPQPKRRFRQRGRTF